MPCHRAGYGKIADGQGGQFQSVGQFREQIGPVLHIQHHSRPCPQAGKQGKRPAFGQKPDVLRPQGGRASVRNGVLKFVPPPDQKRHGGRQGGTPWYILRPFAQNEKDGMARFGQFRAHVHEYGQSSAHARKGREKKEGAHRSPPERPRVGGARRQGE